MTSIVLGLATPLKSILLLCVLATLLVLNRNELLTSRTLRANDPLVESAEVLYVPSSTTMRMLCLGYDQAAADILWLRTLDYFGRHFISDRRYEWLEHLIEQVIALDPRFRRVYHWAGTNVLYGRRFTNANVRMSNYFYERALEQFPDDSEAAYRLGMNYLVELKGNDPETRLKYQEMGLHYIEMAANMFGAPARMKSLVSSLYSKLGKQRLAVQYLTELYLQTDDPAQKAEFLALLQQKRANVDLGELKREHEKFSKGWKAEFPYLSAEMYIALGQPGYDRNTQRGDVDWRALRPDYDLSGVLQSDDGALP